jgi:D-alanine--poly(phosphoribitol) ligase subunit 2
MDTMKQTIKQYIAEKIVGEEIEITDDALLSDIIDSIGLVKLLAFLAEKYNVSIDPGDITTENFDTINQIAEFVRKKTAL